MKYIKDAPIRLMAHLIADTETRCKTHRATHEDIFFAMHSDEFAECLGIESDTSFTIGFLRYLESPPRPLRAPMQKYEFNSKVLELRAEGYSVRAIAKMTGVTKKNVERMLRENPELPGFSLS